MSIKSTILVPFYNPQKRILLFLVFFIPFILIFFTGFLFFKGYIRTAERDKRQLVMAATLESILKEQENVIKRSAKLQTQIPKIPTSNEMVALINTIARESLTTTPEISTRMLSGNTFLNPGQSQESERISINVRGTPQQLFDFFNKLETTLTTISIIRFNVTSTKEIDFLNVKAIYLIPRYEN